MGVSEIPMVWYESETRGKFKMNAASGMLVLPEGYEVEVMVDDFTVTAKLFQMVEQPRGFLGSLFGSKSPLKKKRTQVAKAVKLLDVKDAETNSNPALEAVAETLSIDAAKKKTAADFSEMRERALRFAGKHKGHN